jgi:pimeloyl-ACP methyl ester carboxylesterase
VGLDDIFVEHHGRSGTAPIILVHGAPDRSGTFSAVLPHLRDEHVVLYDRRGYGRSAGAAPPTGMVDHARDLLELIDSVGGACVVVAHSFGANPTMLAVTMRPGAFLAIGCWEPPLAWTDGWPAATKEYNARVARSRDPERAIESTYRHLLGEDAWVRLPEGAQARRRAEGPAFQVDMRSMLEAPFDFADVVVPALVGFGSETTPEHLDGASDLVRWLPDARLHAVPGTGHFAPLTHPREYASFVLRAASLVRS